MKRDAVALTVAMLLPSFMTWFEFTILPERFGARWELVMDTTDPHVEEGSQSWKPGDTLIAGGRSVIVLVRVD